MKWTPTKERCPRQSGKKLVTTNAMWGDRFVGVGYWTGERWAHDLSGTVIAWANLPRAYRGRK